MARLMRHGMGASDDFPVSATHLMLQQSIFDSPIKEEMTEMKRAFAVAIPLLALMVSLPCHAQAKQEPATLRSILLHELRTTHNQADWFAPVSAAVDGLTAEQAAWQPPNGSHSAGQLTYHLLYWNRRNLQQLKGEAQDKFSGNNDETFVKFDDKQWADTVHQLDQVLSDLEKLVASADDQKLAGMAEMISNICTHNAYHTGQIVYARKLQGSWNPEKGVK